MWAVVFVGTMTSAGILNQVRKGRLAQNPPASVEDLTWPLRGIMAAPPSIGIAIVFAVARKSSTRKKPAA
jgi:hypothetical protein